MKKNLPVLLALLLLLCAPLLALAADVAVDSASPLASALAGFLSDVVFPLLGAAALALLGVGLRWLGKKWKIDALQGDMELLRTVAWQAVGYAEEIAAKRIKASKIKLSSNQKLDIAVSKILESAPKISREKAEELVESALAFAKGAGATGEQAL